MWCFEHNGRGEDFSREHVRSLGEAMGTAMYKSIMGPSLKEMFEPSTASGRMAAAAQAWVMFLTMSAYIGNLAAQATTKPAPVQAVTGIESFSSSLPMCVRRSGNLLAYLAASQPALYASLSPANIFEDSIFGSLHALQAVQAGQCAGALLPNTEVTWIMGQNDTAGALCSLIPVGGVLGAEFVPLVFTPNRTVLTDAQVTAINVVLTEATVLAGGSDYGGPTSSFFPTGPRPLCASEDAADAAAYASLAPALALGVGDLGGIYIVQGVGFGLAIILHITKRLRQKVLPCSRPHELEMPAEEGGEEHHEEHQDEEHGEFSKKEEDVQTYSDGGPMFKPPTPRKGMGKKEHKAKKEEDRHAPAPEITTVLLPTRRLTLNERMKLAPVVRTTSDLSYITSCVLALGTRLDELQSSMQQATAAARAAAAAPAPAAVDLDAQRASLHAMLQEERARERQAFLQLLTQSGAFNERHEPLHEK